VARLPPPLSAQRRSDVCVRGISRPTEHRATLQEPIAARFGLEASRQHRRALPRLRSVAKVGAFGGTAVLSALVPPNHSFKRTPSAPLKSNVRHRMFHHKCSIEQQKIVGQRPNPLNPKWSEWTLVICSKCRLLQEWQHHSDEQAHGGDLKATADVSHEYVHYMYALTESDIELILEEKKKVCRYNRHTEAYEESYV
jgi:hypothetical protein